MNNGIKLAAFDMGGVMVNADESIPIAEYSRISNRPENEVFEAIFSTERKRPIETGEITPAEHALKACRELGIDMSETEFWRVHCTSHSPDPAIGELVKSTAGQTRIAIASNLPSPHWDWARENLQFSDLFDPAVLSFEIGVMKPDPRYFEELIRMSGIKAGEIFFTDDNQQNVEAAASVGIKASLFQGVEQLRSDLKACGISV